MDVKKTVLITGGTSGIGLAAAEIFLENGWRAVIVGRDVGRGNCAVRMLKKHSEDVMFVSGDVRTCDGCKDIVEKAISAGSRIDCLVSSAGIYFEKGIMEMSESDYDDIMSVNVRGTYFMAQAAIPELRRHQGASLISLLMQGFMAIIYVRLTVHQRGQWCFLRRHLHLSLHHRYV